MRTILLVAFLSLLAIALVNCRRDVEPDARDCGEATTIDEMMEWVYFKTGSYWIYEEQNSGAIDTMTVYDDHQGVSPTGNREFYVKMESSLDGYTYEYWFNDAWSGNCQRFPGCHCRVVDCEKYVNGNVLGGNHNFIFPLRVGNAVAQIDPNLNVGSSSITHFNDSISLGDLTFHEVFTFDVDFSVQHNYRHAIYRLCKSVGIIEKEVTFYNEHWKLIQYQIMH